MEIINTRVERVRRLVAIIAIAVSFYYLYWRVSETFNPNALVFSWTLFIAELYGTLTTILLYFMVWKIPVRVSPPPLQNRTVDIFIPTKNESTAILRKTLIACTKIRYPHRTMVLDDGNRPEVKALCEELGCVYLAREDHRGAKAGNLNYGLKHSSAEFIAIFDADHVPLSNFIDRTIGYLRDEKIAFVQTPQEFYNIDSFQHRTDRKKKTIWGEQYLFFSVIQPGKDYWNSAYFVGSCALLRRKALDDVGGFAEVSITEDMLTSIHLHAKGWSSVYHNENLAYGVAAETILPFHIQRQRWGIGNWQIFFKANPFFVRGLTLPQRISYISSMTYPLEGLQKIVFYLTPPIALFTGVLPMRALDINYLLHFAPYFLISIFAFNEMGRGYGGQLMLEQQSMGKFFTYLKSLWLFMFRKSRNEFKVTPKGEDKNERTPYGLIIPQALVFMISFVAIIFSIIQVIFGGRQDNFIIAVNCFWALYNSGLAMAIIQYDYKKLFQRRSAFRMPDAILVKYKREEVYASEANSRENELYQFAVADNLTEHGASLICIGQIPSGNQLSMELMTPGSSLRATGNVMHLKSIPGDDQPISQLGVRFSGLSPDVKDFLTHYLHEAAVVKYMKELRTRYKTYIERRLMGDRNALERAYRALGYLPVSITIGDKETYCVLKDVSETGVLLAIIDALEVGNTIIAKVILGSKSLFLKGVVVREVLQQNGDFLEHLYGVRLDESSKTEVKHILAIADKIGGFVQG
ncbi:glycosyltransferase [Geobacter sp.]|uniref:glycosyltransferase n=1 Tax=Geobacter sp. TaxID=46610 RepID=UPI0027B8C0AF|nr:glycosyltransferase [Geobacter sp.]